MLVRAIKLEGVRNLAPVALSPGPRFNVFHGDNGQGKTNLLETIYVVGALRSFRTQRLAEMVAFDAEQAYIGARVARGGMERVYELTQGRRSRKVRLDGKAVRPISKYFGDFNVVLFAPEDLQVPRGSPNERRRFVDRAVFNLRPGYLSDVQDYEKIIKNRNAVLRAVVGGERSVADSRGLLEVYDGQAAKVGSVLIESRRKLLDAIEPLFRAAFGAIAQMDREVAVRFVAPDAVREAGASREQIEAALAAQLRDSRARDFARGTTSVGPHRDDFEFTFGGRPAAAYASQGQLRALVLAWKTAEMDLLAEIHGEPPVLLLDDVSSELDARRNEYLFAFLRGRQSQCFITTTHPKHVLLDAERVDYEIRAGVVTGENRG